VEFVELDINIGKILSDDWVSRPELSHAFAKMLASVEITHRDYRQYYKEGYWIHRVYLPNCSGDLVLALHGLELGVMGLYEVLCSKGMNQFDANDHNGKPLADVSKTTTPENKGIFQSTLDMAKFK
ncbi:hypothetical protein BGZ49_003796, partial [Haplosporangium sp. Z 27]